MREAGRRAPLPAAHLLRRRVLLGTAVTGVLGVACSGGQSHGNATRTPPRTPTASGTGTQPGSATAGTLPAEARGRPGETVVLAASADSPGYDPVALNSAAVGGFVSLVYSGLLSPRNGVAQFPDPADPTLVPDLAGTSPEQPDGVTYIFKLRQGVTWQRAAPMNGRALTAADMVWHYTRAATDAASAVKRAFRALDHAEAVDAGTLKLTLRTPDAAFLTLAAGGPNRFILPREVGEAGKLRTVLIGTGPFTLARHERNVRATFKRNQGYVKRDAAGTPLPYLDGVEFLFVADPALRLQTLQARQTSLSGPLAPEEYKQLRASNGNDYDFLDAPGVGDELFMRVDRPPFDDQRVRRALSLALDRPALIRALARGRGNVDLPIPAFIKDVPALSPDPGAPGSPFTRDLPAAKQLLAAAGHAGGLSTTLSYTAQYGAAFVQEVQSVQAQLREAGIDVALQPLDYAAYLNTVYKGNADGLALGQRAIFPDADPYLSDVYLPGGAAGQTYGSDTMLTDLIGKQRAALDGATRGGLLGQIQAHLSDALYRVPLVAVARGFAWQRGVRNWRGAAWPAYAPFETAWVMK